MKVLLLCESFVMIILCKHNIEYPSYCTETLQLHRSHCCIVVSAPSPSGPDINCSLSEVRIEIVLNHWWLVPSLCMVDSFKAET